jgi:polar amino acid transport system permease protein
VIEFTFEEILTHLAGAARWTVALSAIAFAGGALVGLLLLAMRVSGKPALAWPVRLYVDFFQGTPLLMQLFLVFFGLGLLGINVSPWLAASLALTLFSSAFLAEIWRGSVEAIPRGQWLAGASLGMGFFAQLRHVVLPQALRIALPPTVGFCVQIVKGTALASIIGFVELTKAGTMITNATFKPFLVYGCVALIYFALCFPLSVAARRIERKLQKPL